MCWADDEAVFVDVAACSVDQIVMRAEGFDLESSEERNVFLVVMEIRVVY